MTKGLRSLGHRPQSLVIKDKTGLLSSFQRPVVPIEGDYHQTTPGKVPGGAAIMYVFHPIVKQPLANSFYVYLYEITTISVSHQRALKTLFLPPIRTPWHQGAHDRRPLSPLNALR